MHRGFLRLAVSLLVLAAASAASLAQMPSRTFDDLRQSVPQAEADGVLQMRLRWKTAEPVADPARTTNEFELVSVEPVPGSLRSERGPQVISTSLVIVSVDVQGRELDWRIVQDPRVVRAEADEPGTLTGERLYYLEIQFFVAVPDLPETNELRVYSVRSEGGRALLHQIGAVSLR